MDSFTGEIRIFAFNFAPDEWALCNGVQMPIIQYQMLFSIIDHRFGQSSDPNKFFLLPNLQGRTVAGAYPDASPGGPKLAQTAGAEGVTLTPSNMPAHNHQMNYLAPKVPSSMTDQPGSNYLSRLAKKMSPTDPPPQPSYKAFTAYDAQKTLTPLNPGTISTVGTITPLAHENRQPYLAMNFCISLVGNYPPRP